MAFTDNIKEITPAITQLKSNTPVIVIDGKIYVAGIGGNFIPAGQSAAEPVAGYAVNNDGVITFRPLGSSDSISVSSIKVINTGVEEPAYQGGGGGAQPDINDGVTFILSFNDTIPSYTTTGNSITVINSPSVTTADGVSCIHCNNSGLRVAFQNFGGVYNSLNFAVSYWAKSTAGTSLARNVLVFCSSTSYTTAKNLAIGSSIYQADYSQYSYELDDTNWHHYLLNSDNGQGTFYVDGSLLSSFTLQTPSMGTSTNVFVGGLPPNWSYTGSSFAQSKDCYIANIRVFYRSITQSQITTLYNELTPTNS